MALASVGRDARGDVAVGLGRGNVLALEVGQEALVSLVELAGAAESVDLAGAAEVGRAGGVGAGVGGGEEGPVDGVLGDDVDVLEDVTLGENVATLADLEGVAAVVVPVVVDLGCVSGETRL